MKERGKRAAAAANDDVSFSDCYHSSSSDLPCRKHPSVSAVGICPYCLNDRLVNLVCSECGEQRLSSCSCSDFSPNRSSSAAAVEVGSVGRISFLIENEKTSNNEGNANSNTKEKDHKTEEVVLLKRSSSSCVEIKRKSHQKNGFWRFGKLFRKSNAKREQDFAAKSVLGDEKTDSWMFDYNENKKIGVSRSRSLCSFRGGGFWVGSEDGSSYSGARSSISAARSSSVNGGLPLMETEPRRSCFEGRKSNFSETEHRKSNFSETEPRRSCFEGRKSNFSETEPRRSCFEGRKSNFSETEQRRSNFSETDQRRSYLEGRKSNFSETEHRKSDAGGGLNRRVFSLKESYFGEEPGFIDLKFDFSSSEQKQDYSVLGSTRSCGDNDAMFDHGGGSCRISVSERGIKKSRRSFKGWRWIFGHQHGRKKDDDGDVMVDP